jgi:hypothetical protein
MSSKSQQRRVKVLNRKVDAHCRLAGFDPKNPVSRRIVYDRIKATPISPPKPA